MAFKTVRAEDVVGKIIQEWRRAGLSYFPVNSKGRGLSAVLSREVESSSKFFNTNFDKTYAKYASGRLLESLCEIFGIVREQATIASAFIWERSVRFYVSTGTFGDINGGADFTIGAGERIWTGKLSTYDEPIYYTTTSPTVCSASKSEVFVSVEAVAEGSSHNTGPNTLVKHGFIGYTGYAAEGLKVKNNYAIVNGQNRETDDDLRFRLANAATAAEQANESALRMVLLAVPGLIDSKIIQYFDGIGTTAAFIAGQGNETSLSMLKQAQIAVEQVSANGVMANVYAPPQVGISFITRVNLSTAITVNEQNELTARLQDLVRQSILNVRIGGRLSLAKLFRDMVKVDPRIISFGTKPTTTPFDELYVYRTSTADSTRVRSEWIAIDEIVPEGHEVLISEYSLANPFVFNWQVYA